jgi:hypothetical protein
VKWVELNHEEELFLQGSRCETCNHLLALHQILGGMHMICLVCVARTKPYVVCQETA